MQRYDIASLTLSCFFKFFFFCHEFILTDKHELRTQTCMWSYWLLTCTCVSLQGWISVIDHLGHLIDVGGALTLQLLRQCGEGTQHAGRYCSQPDETHSQGKWWACISTITSEKLLVCQHTADMAVFKSCTGGVNSESGPEAIKRKSKRPHVVMLKTIKVYISL